MSGSEGELKPLFWVGDSRKKLRAFPGDVKDVMGFALHQAQAGQKHVCAKPLKGFGGAGVLEVVDDHDGEAYRSVYTVKLAGAVYVLHAFQKKAKHGIATPQKEIKLVRERLKLAQEHHEEWRKKSKES